MCTKISVVAKCLVFEQGTRREKEVVVGVFRKGGVPSFLPPPSFVPSLPFFLPFVQQKGGAAILFCCLLFVVCLKHTHISRHKERKRVKIAWLTGKNERKVLLLYVSILCCVDTVQTVH